MINTGIFIRNDDRLIESIEYLKKHTKLKYIVFKDQDFDQVIKTNFEITNIECLSHYEFIRRLKDSTLEELDYIFSYYYQKKLENSILNYAKQGCINFHPAPLPKYRGVGNYSKCIMDGLDYWGVSAHYMDEKFDNGKIIQAIQFSVDPNNETYIGLENKTQRYMFELFCSVVDKAVDNNLKAQNIEFEEDQVSYLSRNMIDKLKLIDEGDDIELINRKIRAFWSPPFRGASIMVNNIQYTLIDDKILKELDDLYKEKYRR